MTERKKASASRPTTRNGGLPEPSDLIRSVQRAFRVLEVTGSASDGLTVKQIARRCEMALPTTYHIVRTLTWEDYLIRGEGGRYQVGLAVSDRYSDLVKALSGPSTVDEVLRRIVGDTGYSHFVGKIVDGRAAVTTLSEGVRSPHVEELIIGFDDGAHAHALGKALLSTMSADERHDYLKDAGMRRYTDATMTDPRELDYDLASRARQGVYTEIGQFYKGVGCAGTVVCDDPDPSCRTVIACTMPLQDLRLYGARVKRRLRRAADEMAPLLG
ncbi:MAG: IclR family transcriptional regulator [Stackebrandtia sp.]